jgi:hypothetical protein
MSLDVTYETRLEHGKLLWRPSGKTGLWEIYSPTIKEEAWRPLFLAGATVEPLNEFIEIGITLRNAGLHSQPPPLEQAQGIVGDRIRDRIQSFANKWGGLGICEHGLPWHHGAPWGHGMEADEKSEADATKKPGVTLQEPINAVMKSGKPWRILPRFCGPYSEHLADGEWCVERLSAWMDYSLAVFALRHIVGAERNKKTPERWAILHLENLCYGAGDPSQHFKNLAGEEAEAVTSPNQVLELLELVRARLSDWTLYAPIRLSCEIDPKTWQFHHLDYLVDYRFGIFPLIASQLLFLLCDPKGKEVAECAGCSNWFRLMTSKATRGKHLYCDTCRAKGIPHRDAERQSRNKQQGDL